MLWDKVKSRAATRTKEIFSEQEQALVNHFSDSRSGEKI